jgi:hypothetical protein
VYRGLMAIADERKILTDVDIREIVDGVRAGVAVKTPPVGARA